MRGIGGSHGVIGGQKRLAGVRGSQGEVTWGARKASNRVRKVTEVVGSWERRGS